MPNRRSLVLAPLLLALLPACAAIEKEHRQDMQAARCHYDGAFEEGMNDGRAGRDMNSGFASLCAASQQPGVRAGYREGYQSGLASRAAELAAAPRHRGFVCEVSVFGDTFTAFGATEEEARAATRAQCGEKRGKTMFCSDPACRPNR